MRGGVATEVRVCRVAAGTAGASGRAAQPAWNARHAIARLGLPSIARFQYRRKASQAGPDCDGWRPTALRGMIRVISRTGRNIVAAHADDALPGDGNVACTQAWRAPDRNANIRQSQFSTFFQAAVELDEERAGPHRATLAFSLLLLLKSPGTRRPADAAVLPYGRYFARGAMHPRSDDERRRRNQQASAELLR